VLRGLENFHKSFTERYEYKPIRKKLYRPLLWILDIIMLFALWLMFFRARGEGKFLWLGFGILLTAAIGYFVVITRTRR
jgi:hypothetical protein